MTDSRLPPNNVAAERAVLGNCLVFPEAIADAAEAVRPGDFFRHEHRLIFTAMCELHEHGHATDPVMVAETLRRGDELDAVGGESYLASLAAQAATPTTTAHHAALVRDLARLRALIGAAAAVAGEAYEGAEPAAAILDRAQAVLAAIADTGRTGGAAPLADDLSEAFSASERAAKRGLAGASTGFQTIDYYTSGMIDNELWTIGGPTGSGKSALAQVIAAHVAESGGQVYFASLEMRRVDLVHRLVAMRSGLDLLRVVNGRLDADGWRRYGEALNQARDTAARMHVDARSRLTLADVRAELRRLSRGGARVALAVVDYMQLVTPSARQGTREREVAETARGLKALAGEFSCPIIGVSQLSREADRAGAPSLSHLRESGEIGQASDVVILLPGVEPDTTTVEAQLAKVRKGRKGPFPLAWHGPSTRFRDPSAVDELLPAGVSR